MRLSAILLFLHLWGNVEVSSSLNTCSTLPDVRHALVSEETKKDEYQEGDVIHFTCEPGYTSSQTSKYVCTRGGWLAVRQGTCYSCSTLPDVPHALVSEETKRDEYQEGDMIDFTCEPGYTSSQTSKYVCTRGGWLAVRQGTCYSCSTLPDVPHALVSEETKRDEYQEGDMIDFTCEPGYTSSQTSKYVCTRDGWLAARQGTCYFLTSSCDPPPAGSFTVKGLPENDEPIGPAHIITVSCDGPGKHLNGSSVLICGEDGQWNAPFPSCIDMTCKVDVMHHNLIVTGLQVKIGHKLQFQCSNNFVLEGPEEIECLETGQWNAPFPTCAAETCEVRDVPRNVNIITRLQGHQLRKGEKLKFGCLSSRHYLRGNAEVECLPGGQWSDPFPTCGDPEGCGEPPPLEDGGTAETLKPRYSHGESVRYACQNLYTMEGDPYKTCSNGQWTGEMKCLRPCTVNKEIMDRHNIVFKHTGRQKLYSTHNDVIEFVCRGQTRHDRTTAMRQRCLDGVMTLPTCH